MRTLALRRVAVAPRTTASPRAPHFSSAPFPCADQADYECLRSPQGFRPTPPPGRHRRRRPLSCGAAPAGAGGGAGAASASPPPASGFSAPAEKSPSIVPQDGSNPVFLALVAAVGFAVFVAGQARQRTLLRSPPRPAPAAAAPPLNPSHPIPTPQACYSVVAFGSPWSEALARAAGRLVRTGAFRQVWSIVTVVTLLRVGVEPGAQALRRLLHGGGGPFWGSGGGKLGGGAHSAVPPPGFVPWEKTTAFVILQSVFRPIEILLYAGALGVVVEAVLPTLTSVPAAYVSHIARTVSTLCLLVALGSVVFRVKERLLREASWQYELSGEKSQQRRVEGLDKLVTFLTVLLGGTLGLQAVGFDVNSLLAIGGIGGIALSLAGREILENLFNGVVILSSRPFEPGDEVWFKPAPTTLVEGIVVDIGWLRTQIRSFEREVWVVPNAVFSKVVVLNISRKGDEWRFRQTLNFGLDAADPANGGILRRIVSELRTAIQSDPRVLAKLHRRVFVNSIGGDRVSVHISFYLQAPTEDAARAMREDLMLSFLDIVRANGGDEQIARPRVSVDLEPPRGWTGAGGGGANGEGNGTAGGLAGLLRGATLGGADGIERWPEDGLPGGPVPGGGPLRGPSGGGGGSGGPGRGDSFVEWASDAVGAVDSRLGGGGAPVRPSSPVRQGSLAPIGYDDDVPDAASASGPVVVAEAQVAASASAEAGAAAASAEAPTASAEATRPPTPPADIDFEAGLREASKQAQKSHRQRDSEITAASDRLASRDETADIGSEVEPWVSALAEDANECAFSFDDDDWNPEPGTPTSVWRAEDDPGPTSKESAFRRSKKKP